MRKLWENLKMNNQNDDCVDLNKIEEESKKKINGNWYIENDGGISISYNDFMKLNIPNDDKIYWNMKDVRY